MLVSLDRMQNPASYFHTIRISYRIDQQPGQTAPLTSIVGDGKKDYNRYIINATDR